MELEEQDLVLECKERFRACTCMYVCMYEET